MTKFTTACAASLLALSVSLTGTSAAKDAALNKAVEADYQYVLDLYTHFHENPELSYLEKESAARMAKEWRELGFTVTEGLGDKWVREKVKTDVGSVADGVGGYGVIGVL